MHGPLAGQNPSGIVATKAPQASDILAILAKLSQAIQAQSQSLQGQSTGSATANTMGTQPANESQIPAGLDGLKYESLPETETTLLGPPDEKYANMKQIRAYVPTPVEAGQLHGAGIANVFSPQWQEQIRAAAERNGGLGNAQDGYLAWSKNGFVRLKNDNLTPEQNRRIAEMTLQTGTHLENTPARSEKSVASDEGVNNWVNTFISRHDKELTDFLANPKDGYDVSDGRKKYRMEFNQEAGAVVSYHFKKSGGLKGFVQKNMKYIQPVLDAVSTVGSFIPGVGTVVAFGAQAVKQIATTIATGKLKASQVLSTVASAIPGSGAVKGMIQAGANIAGSLIDTGKLTASTIVNGISSFFGTKIPAGIKNLASVAANIYDTGKVSLGNIISGVKALNSTFNSPNVTPQEGSGATETAAYNKPSFIKDTLGKLWNLPNTALGLGWGLAGVPFGAKMSFGNNAIQFTDHPFMLNGSAITLGNTISYDSATSPAEVGNHELQHTYQGQALGPLYLPMHLMEGLQGLIQNGSWHGPANDLESGPQSTPATPWS
jgi:hypothetical protein